MLFPVTNWDEHNETKIGQVAFETLFIGFVSFFVWRLLIRLKATLIIVGLDK
jgi:hypothetical protein